MRETWYVLEDGRVVSPNDVAPDAGGKLVNKDGVAVAMRGDAYSSRSVDVDEAKAKPATKDVKPEEQKRGYKTRESKAN